MIDLNRTISQNLENGADLRARRSANARRVKSGPVSDPSVSPSQRESYQVARDASIRARVSRSPDTPQNMASLARLDRILSSGQPLRGDVPRGYYLNIVV